MIAAVLAVRGAFVAEEEDREDEVRHSDFDTDKDGKISVDELENHLGHLFVAVDVLRERIQLECDLRTMMFKQLPFLTSFVCFVVMINMLSPTEQVSMAHRHIVKHFGVEKENLDAIADYDGIYDFMLSFDDRNAELQATSAHYWCEHRYFEHTWDHHYMTPLRSCVSPRQYALGLSHDANAAWDVYNGHADAAESDSSSTDSHSSGGHRRMSSSSGSHDSHVELGCHDNDHELQEEEGDEVTCAGNSSEVCLHDVGVALCPESCGFCWPYTYDYKKKFDKPQITMLPVVVHQSRFGCTDCHGFAEVFEHQPSNPNLVLFPALDGEREGRLLTCMDRDPDKAYDAEFSHLYDCPDDPHQAPHAFCKDGIMNGTRKVIYHDEPIYPEMLAEPEKNVNAMRAVGWLDVKTNTVTLSTLIFTEGMELFTSLSVVFSIDEAGNVVASKKMVSYRDLVNEYATRFITMAVLTTSCATIGLVLSLHTVIKNPECKFGFEMYELLSRVALFVYALDLLIEWSQQELMKDEFDHLLHALLEWTDLDGDDQQILTPKLMGSILTPYFEVKEEIYNETQWLNKFRIGAFIVIYSQFVQLMLYFAAHPKMGSLTETVGIAYEGLKNFLVMFMMLFLMLAWMAHWMFGGIVLEFATLSEAIRSQATMLFGEFIYAQDADHLLPTALGMYWLYAGTFLLIVYFTLLNFFLAIVVEAFYKYQKKQEEMHTAKDFITDCMDVISTGVKYKMCRWPHQRQVLRYLLDRLNRQRPSYGLSKFQRNLQKCDAVVLGEDGHWDRSRERYMSPSDFLTAFPDHFETMKDVAAFLLYYYMKCGYILTKDLKKIAAEKEAQEAADREKQENAEGGDAAVKNPEIEMLRYEEELKVLEAKLHVAEDTARQAEAKALKSEVKADDCEQRLRELKAGGSSGQTAGVAAIAKEVAERVAMAAAYSVAYDAAQRTADTVRNDVYKELQESEGLAAHRASLEGNGTSYANNDELNRHCQLTLERAMQERLAAERMLHDAREETQGELKKAKDLLERALNDLSSCHTVIQSTV